MSKSGYDTLVDIDNTQDEISPFDDSNAIIPKSILGKKIVTSEPLSSSLPVVLPGFGYSKTDKRRSNGKQLDLEAQPLLDDIRPFNDPTLEFSPFDNKLTRRPSRTRSIISLDLKSINEKVSKWTSSLWTTSPKINITITEIQYSVFKPLDKIKPLQNFPPDGFINSGPVSQLEFNEIVEDSIKAINDLGIQPLRISAGSSGSYFIYNTKSEIVGVFKPKDEEPYGPLSPKWTKWLHRNLFPCFFGRSCLIPNLGYICESAASLLDCQLNTFIVPFTGVVSIASDSFYYSYWDRRSKKTLPPKIGSFQLFLDGYMGADQFFQKYPLPGSKWSLPGLYYTAYNGTQVPTLVEQTSECCNNWDNQDLDNDLDFRWTPDVIQQFREELEKLVILDYIMRNTDRGLDNWMIKIEWETRLDGKKHPTLKIGAIDSGLAFPWKHPDEWRSYPFGWLFLPVSIIGQPFSENTRRHFLPLLTSTKWWEESSVLFRNLFAKDSDFKERMWKKQWRVLKGQAFNVVETLKNPTYGPLELVRRTRMLVQDQEMEVSVTIPVSMMQNAINTPMLVKPTRTINKSKNLNLESSNPNSSKYLDIINEDENSNMSTKPGETPRTDDNYENDPELQKNWNDLLSGDINEYEFQANPKYPKPDSSRLGSLSGFTDGGDSGVLGSPNNGKILSADQSVDSARTKTVIIERIQAVTSRPPVFACC